MFLQETNMVSFSEVAVWDGFTDMVSLRRIAQQWRVVKV